MNVCGLSHCEVIGRLRGAPQVVHLAVRRTSTPTDIWHNGSQNIGDGDHLTSFQATADRDAGEPTSVRSSSSSCYDKTSCVLDGSNAEVGWHSKASLQNQVKLTEDDSRNGSTMVSKLNKPSSTEPNEREGPQRHPSSPSECSTPDMVQSGTTRTVLWEPKVSGSVKSRISNFEAHLQPSQGWQSPVLLGRKPLSQSSQELGHEKVKKLGPLQKFPSLPESQSTVDALETSAKDGQWCSAIVSKPYRPRFAPRLMRSQTMPTVCQGSSSSVAAATTDAVRSVVASSGSLSPSTPETPPPWFAELRSRKLQQRPPWWSRANSVDESGGAGIPPKSPDSFRRKTVSPTLLTRRFTLEVTATSIGNASAAVATSSVRRQSSNASPQKSPVALVSPIQKPSLRPVGSFETKTHSTDEPKNRTVPQTNGFSKASVQVTRAATVHQLTRSFEVPFQRDVTKRPASLALFHQDTKLDELHRQFHFISKESVFDVSLVKNSRGLGISICGGNDQDPGDPLTIFIRIKKLYPLQPALESGRLEVGDIILKVNGRHLTNLKHSEAVDVLRIAPANVVLLICRPPPGTLPPVPQNDGALVNSSLLSLSSLNLLGLGNNVVPLSQKFPKESVMVLEKINGSLGFTLHKKDEHHPGHFIKALVREPALSDGRLQPGDQILEVNGIDISRMSHYEAINALRASPNQVTLTVRRSDDQTMSPLSPLSPTSPLSHDIPNGRHDKKTLRKEAQDLLSDNCRKRNSGIVSGPYEAPIARRHRHKGRSSPSAVSGDSASDIAESLSSTSDADSRRTTPTLTRRSLDRPESNKSDSWSQQTDLSRDSSMNSLVNGTAETSTNKMSRPMSLDLNQESRKKGEQPVLNCAPVSICGPSRVPSLCVSKWESDSTASADDTDTDSSGNARKQLVVDEQKNLAQSSLVPPNLRHSMSDGNFTSESRKSLVQQPWHSSADDNNVQRLKKWRGTELPFPVKTEHQSKTVNGGNMSQDAFTVELDRYWNSRLGFSLISVEIGKLKGSFIRAIHPDSLASRDGRLKPGDQILKVNDAVISGMNTDDVIEMLRKLKGKITLAVLRNPAITNSVLTLIQLQSS